ncbi:FcoT family thioesterase [Micromonospora sp. NBC_01796]|uniref:FcoT family thioesterase n=1 Tax=Micromonospora sp. NBC_01796 TaxID=2975987 RepID=UPI002DD82F66|nr:FcoT family thioesterase [Micromonospora sp. NBC_01796]WSA86649.1 FcoT family thioesterase [Micromonospora sp. NBC_01796]
MTAEAGTTTSAANGTATVGFPDDPAVRERVLRPYRPHAQYLKSARVRTDGDRVTALCEFGVAESWYIDSTGHFNSVEFNICYNQVAYYLLAMSVREHLLPVFDTWTMADYWQRQLPNVLITELRSRFRRAIDPTRFTGELAFTNAQLRAGREGRTPLLIIDTECRFWDDRGGRCDGEVRLVLTDPPTGAVDA